MARKPAAGAAPECLFCSIVSGVSGATPGALLPLPAADAAVAAAFLDHRPVFKGHVLVVPRVHCEVLTELPAGSLGPLFQAVQRVTAAVEAGLGAGGSFVAMNNRISQSVPHLHVHVVPRHKGDGLRGFFWPRTRYASDAEQAEYHARIAAALSVRGKAAAEPS